MSTNLQNNVELELHRRDAVAKWGSVGVTVAACLLAGVAPYLAPASGAVAGVLGVLLDRFTSLPGVDAAVDRLTNKVKALGATTPAEVQSALLQDGPVQDVTALVDQLAKELDADPNFKVLTDGGSFTLTDVVIQNMSTYFEAKGGGSNDVRGIDQRGGSATFVTKPGSQQNLHGSVFSAPGSQVIISGNPDCRVILGGGGTVIFNGRTIR